jgi:HEAT repeat protein
MGGPPDSSLPTDRQSPAQERRLAPPEARRREAALAGHRGDTGQARSFLTDPEPVVRATALRALARIDDLDEETWSGAARDPDPSVRRAAAEVLGRSAGNHTPVTSADPLLSLLADTDPTVVEMAAWAAGEVTFGSECGARLAELTTTHDEPLVREAAVAALGAVGDPAGLPAILAATEDRATVRRRAVLALAPFEGDQVDRALERARSDRDWQVRQAAEDLS